MEYVNRGRPDDEGGIGVDGGRSLDAMTVEERAVATAQIGDLEIAVDGLEPQVLARHPFVHQEEAVAFPADVESVDYLDP